MPHTITIAVAAYNEQEMVLHTIEEILAALEGLQLHADILIVDDASRDGTAAFCLQAQQKSPRVRVYRNPTNRGFGGSHFRGAELATTDWYMMLPGDNGFERESIRKLLSHIGEAEMIIPYTTNPQIRTWDRRLLSRGFVAIVNAITGHRLRYYNGPVIHRTANLLLPELAGVTSSFAFQAETICTLLDRGASFMEVGVDIQEHPSRRSNALRWKNIIGVTKTLATLLRRRLGLGRRVVPSGLNALDGAGAP